MKYVLSALILFQCLIGHYLHAQQVDNKAWCGTKHIHQSPFVAGGQRFEEDIFNSTRRSNERLTGVDRLSVQVVVHIIHNGETQGKGSNLLYDQIEAQIELLNLDFSARNPNLQDTETQFAGLIGNPNIQFVLARVSPDGKLLAEAGVNRLSFPQKDWTPDAFNKLVKPLTQWDTKRYLNIWVVDIANDTEIGFSTPPSSWLPKESAMPPVNPLEEGIVVDYQYFGDISQRGGAYLAESAFGRVLTHEMGHFLGLLHPWGTTLGKCDSDFCEDTPPVDAFHSYCGVRLASKCSNKPVMMQNFMDYSPEQCRTFFTDDQAQRMRTCLELAPSRIELLNAGARKSEMIAAFTASSKEVCAGETIVFENLAYSLYGLVECQAEWEFEGGIIEKQNANKIWVRYAKAGIYDVKLKVSTDYELDKCSYENYVLVKNQSNQANALVWPSNAIKDEDKWHFKGDNVFMPYAQGLMTGSYTVQKRSFAILESPHLSLLEPDGRRISDLILSLEWAGAGAMQDSFLIEVSEDCGSTYKTIWFKNGQSLASRPHLSNLSYPHNAPQATDFVTDFVSFKPLPETQLLRFRLVLSGLNGNMFYIKKIAIADANPSLPIATIEPEHDYALVGETVRFFDVSTGSPLRLNYTFEAANTRMSSERSPRIAFVAAGAFRVGLEASNERGSSYTEIMQKVLDAKKYYDPAFEPNRFKNRADFEVIQGAAVSYKLSQFRLKNRVLIGVDAFFEEIAPEQEVRLGIYKKGADGYSNIAQVPIKASSIEKQLKKGACLRVIFDEPLFINDLDDITLGITSSADLYLQQYDNPTYLAEPIYDNGNNAAWKPYKTLEKSSWALFPIFAFSKDASPEKWLTVYPNPSQGALLHIKSEGHPIHKVQIIGLDGHVLLDVPQVQTKDMRASNRYYGSVGIHDLTSGLYIAKIYTRNGVFAQKITVVSQ